MAKFQFPESIEYDNMRWHLIYAPSNDNTIMPNLNGFTVRMLTCQPVQLAGRQNPIYMTVMDMVCPAHRNERGEAVAEKWIKGFRTYSQPPINPNTVQPVDCVLYLTVPQAQGESATQRFFDAIIGQSQKEQERQARVDAAWCDELATLRECANEQPANQPDAAERAVSD